MNTPALGIDFGTSNSAAGVMEAGKPHLIDMAPGETTLPTTFFFDFDTRKTLIGRPANQALLDGIEGRFMRALKRVLGTGLMHEKRQILNDRVTFVDIIARFLAELKLRAEKATGQKYDRVVSGRPVVFHGIDDPREQQAEDDLRACYHAAGFKDVSFLPEPEAAAIAYGATGKAGQIGLIVDIGGGTSDFSLFESTPKGATIHANHGVRIGGTDFDRAVSIDRVMPLFGKGTLLRDTFGPGTALAPNAIFNDLATWEKIPFLYTTKHRRMVSDMVRQAEEPEKLARLDAVLENELGHDVAFAVEAGKIAANTDDAVAHITLTEIEKHLTATLTTDMLAAILSPFADRLEQAAKRTLSRADIQPNRVDMVIYVGGSSLVSMVPSTMKSLFPDADHRFSNVFTAVADGLAIASSAPQGRR